MHLQVCSTCTASVHRINIYMNTPSKLPIVVLLLYSYLVLATVVQVLVSRRTHMGPNYPECYLYFLSVRVVIIRNIILLPSTSYCSTSTSQPTNAYGPELSGMLFVLFVR